MTSRVFHLAIVAEDVNLAELSAELVRAVAREQGEEVRIDPSRLTRGCRGAELRRQYDRALQSADAVVVVADAGYVAADRKRPPTHRQKILGLMQLLPADIPKPTHVAAADPCAEGWLLSLGPAVARCLKVALGVSFEMPPHWPAPRGERDAKESLARRIAHGTRGQRLPRAGFEFCAEIVAAALPLAPKERSLADFVQGVRRLMSR